MFDIACDEFETFVASLPAVQGRYLQTRRTVRPWRLQVFSLEGVTLMMARGGAINVFHGATPSHQLTFYIPLSDPRAVALGGEVLDRHRIGMMVPGLDYLLRTDAPTHWMGIHISLESVRHRLNCNDSALAELLAASRAVDFPSYARREISGLGVRLSRIAIDEPEALAELPARTQAAQQLIELVLSSIAATLSAPSNGARRSRRQRQVARCMEWVEQRQIDIPTVDDLCALSGVSDRTLRTLFVEQIGMAPHAYLMAMRMQAIHQALKPGRPGETVTKICSRYGVWDLGRFAGQYRTLYGMSPSQQLAASIARV